jgi:hypothetical protein
MINPCKKKMSNYRINISKFTYIYNKGNKVKNENLSEFYLWTLLVFYDTIPQYEIIQKTE